jgi:hypothetical protein
VIERFQGESGDVRRWVVVEWEEERWGAKRVCREKSLRRQLQKEEETEAGRD